MNTHVCWMLELQVREGRDEEFRALMAEMAAATEASEPGTLDYEWSLSADGRQWIPWALAMVAWRVCMMLSMNKAAH